MSNQFKITLHMAASLDGMIARTDNSVAWFETSSPYEKGEPEKGAWEYFTTVDCYVMGARTYEHAIELSKSYGWPYADVPTIVVTHKDLPVRRPNTETFSGELAGLVNQRLKPRYNNVCVLGGAMLVKEFLRAGLADEIRMSVIPIILGDGLPFFDHIQIEQAVHLKEVKAYKNGVVELCYVIK